MAKTSGEFERGFIETAKKETGKTLEQWLKVIKTSGLSKQMEITNWVKKEHGLNHLQATLLAGLYLNDGKPVYQDEDNLLEARFAGAEEMKMLFNEVSKFITGSFPGTTLIPKKTYLSFTAKREFAAVNIKPGEIRLGLDLGNEPFSGSVEKTKLRGPMPRMSHMIVLTKSEQLKTVKPWLEVSYKRSHP